MNEEGSMKYKIEVFRLLNLETEWLRYLRYQLFKLQHKIIINSSTIQVRKIITTNHS